VAATFIAGCWAFTTDYSSAGRHQAFKEMYSRQVGLSVDNATHSWLARYPDSVVGKLSLPSGNIEVEYIPQSWRNGCRVFFEVDEKTRIVIGWRFEGDEKACTWVGP